MGGGYLTNAGVFLINTLFYLYIAAVMLRFLFQLVRADFYNPVSQAIVAVTNPPLRALRRWIPPVGHLDTASLVLMFLVQMINVWLVMMIVGRLGAISGILVLTIAELLQKFVHIFMFAILVQVVASWVAPSTYNPLLDLLQSLTRPLIRPVRRLLPAVGGLDFSPMVVLVLLQLASMLLVAPIRDFGNALL